MAETIKIATVNCQGLSTPSKRKDVLNYYKNKKYSILCLQDTHFIQDLEPYIEAQWGYKCVFNSYASNSRGVAVFFNNVFELVLHREKRDNSGNILALDISVDQNRLTLINLYGPNNDEPEFFEKVREVVLDFDNLYFIICGDFNISLNQQQDTFNYTHINNPKAKKKLIEIIEDIKLVDYFRVLNPDKQIYTWRRKTPIKQARLDFFLTSENLCNCIENIQTKAGYRSDHSVVVLELKFNTFTKGKGLWKFSNHLLKDHEYVLKVKETIERVKLQYANILYNKENIKDIPNSYINLTIKDSLFLETLLMEIRGQTISHSSYRKKEQNKAELELEKEINEIEKSIPTETNLAILENKKKTLENLRKEKLKGTIIRSKAVWVDEGEKPTEYFCNLEARNYINKTIQKLDVEGKGIIRNQEQILLEVKTFYEKLYGINEDLMDVNLAEILQPFNVPKLDRTTADPLEECITETEILAVLKNMKNNKSPGSDGFTTEFYKFFWNDLKDFLVRAVNDVFTNKKLPISQRLGIITC